MQLVLPDARAKSHESPSLPNLQTTSNVCLAPDAVRFVAGFRECLALAQFRVMRMGNTRHPGIGLFQSGPEI